MKFEHLLDGATKGPYFADHHKGTAEDFEAHAASGLATVDTGREGDWPIAYFCAWPQARYIERLTPEVMREVWAALKLAELNYKRTNHDRPDLMGDDEHEAWGAILRAVALLDGQTEKGGAE